MSLANWWLTQAGGEPKELQALRLMNLVWAGFSDLVQGRMWLPPARSAAGGPARRAPQQ